MNVKVLNTCRS